MAGPFIQDALLVWLRPLGADAMGINDACCRQMEAWLALQEASWTLQEILGKTLAEEHPIACHQSARNKKCIEARCPLWSAGNSQLIASHPCP